MDATSFDIIITILILMTYSILYRENIFYHFIEVIVIGFLMGYTIYAAITTLQSTLISPLMAGALILIVPAISGILLYTTFIDRYRFLSRWVTAAVAGTGMGLATSRSIPVSILGQISGLYLNVSKADAFTIINWLIILSATISGLAYFIFTKEHKGVLGKVTKLGLIFMMVAFGTTFGASNFTKQSYVIPLALLISKMPQFYIVLLAAAIVVFDIIWRSKKKKET